MSEATAAARREARRRRILENSENRLKKITGTRENGVCENLDEKDGYPNGPLRSKLEEDSWFNCDDHDTVDKSEDGFDTWEDQLSAVESRMKFLDRIIGETDTKEEIQKSGVLSLFALTKLHFICLALVVRILHSLQYGFIFGESIFIPFLTVEMLCLVMLKLNASGQQSINLLRTVLILSGVSSGAVEAFTKFIYVMTSVGRDFAVYFVTFILFHIILIWATQYPNIR